MIFNRAIAALVFVLFANAAAAEALTSILIQINRSGIVSHSGIKIIGQEH